MTGSTPSSSSAVAANYNQHTEQHSEISQIEFVDSNNILNDNSHLSTESLHAPFHSLQNATKADPADTARVSAGLFIPPSNNNTTRSMFPIIFPSRNILLKVAFSTVVTLYILNQKHLLPKPLSAIVSKTLFWPTLPISMMKRIGVWCNTDVDDVVVMGGAPFGFMNMPRRLRDDFGVRGVINMCEEYKGPTKEYEKLGMEELWLPTTDHFEPSFDDLRKAVEFIQQFKDDLLLQDGHDIEGRGEEKKEGTETDRLLVKKKGKAGRVYVHCRAGHGRSAAVVYAWLLSQEEDISNVDMKKLNEKLSSKRNVRKTLWKQKNINQFRSWLHIGRN